MRKKFLIIISVLLFMLCGTAIFNINNGKIALSSSNNTTFFSFANSVLDMLKSSPLEEDYDKVFDIDDDLTYIDNTLMIDGETFCKVTNSEVKLSASSCEILKEDKSILINDNDNILLVNNTDIVVIPSTPKTYNNKLYFPLQEVATNLGFEVLQTQDKVILSNPYQTKRLIVSSAGAIDNMGAIRKVEGYNNLHILEYKTEEECKKALETYNKQKNVEWAEVDKIYSINDLNNNVDNTETNSSSLSNSNENNNLLNNLNNNINSNKNKTVTVSAKSKTSYVTWGADVMGVAEYSNYLQNLGTLNQVIVAVLDTGLDSDHEWFAGRVATGGKNFSTSTSSTAFEYEDVEGHGTHVAGTIVDLTLSNVKILPIKVMNDNGYGSTSNILLGIQYVTNLKNGSVVVNGVSSNYYNNLIAINLSLGGTSSVGSTNYNAYNSNLTTAYNNGIIPVVAAGNDGLDATNTSPANVNCAITVSAVGRAGGNAFYRPYWSNWGQYIDVSAPGEDIVSACVGGGTISLDGTSMATPHVAGVVALLYSSGSYASNNAGAVEVTNLIKNNAVDLGDVGWDNYYGEGLCNIAYAYSTLLEDNVIFSSYETKHTNSFNLTLSYPVSGSTIFYTVDGTEPTLNNATEYTNTIPINKTQIIKARAFVLDGSNNITAFSKVTSQVYIIGGMDVNNAFTVTSNGELTSYNGLLTEVTVPTSYNGITITSVGEKAFTSANPIMVTLPETVTSIGKYGFYGCSNLQRVVGTGVKEIGMYAFYFSDSLVSVTDNEFPELITIDKYAFSNCVSLQEINLSKVTLVDYFAFSNDTLTSTSLTGITLLNAVTIGDYAFYGTTNLETITLPKAEFIGCKAFLDCNLKTLNLPKAKYIGLQSFEGNKNLTSATLPELIFVGCQSFYECSKLASVEIPKAKNISSIAFASTGLTQIDMPEVETIGVEAFHNCTKLTNFSAPNLKSIKAEAFYNCSSLQEINLPNVVNIEREAFYNITSVESVTLSKNLEYISSVAFNRFNKSCVFYIYENTTAKSFVTDFKTSSGTTIKYQIISEDLSIFNYTTENNQVTILGVNLSGLTELEVPSYINNLPVTKIGENAFKNCSVITNLNLTFVTVIEASAFSGCINLTKVSLPKINSIGANAFNGCSNLVSVDITNATSIGVSAFYNCPKLTKVELGENIKSIGSQALGFASGFTLLGFEGVAENYATKNNVTFHNVFKNLGRYYFNYYTNNGVTEISITLVDSYTQGGVIIPASYTTGGKTYNITKIGDNAFENCVLITNVKLPSSIKTLGSSAFYNCTSLKTINLNYITSIGSQCFSRCENLQSVTLTNIVDVSTQCFAYCYNLETANLPQAKIISDRAFYFCVGLNTVISPNLQTIEYGGFANCYKLKNINLNTVITLGTLEEDVSVNAKFTGSVFENCYDLGAFVYLANVKNLGGQLFESSGVKNVVIGKNFNYYSQNYLYRPTDSSITIYGYSNYYAQTYANRYKYTFVPIGEFSLLNNVELNRTCFENEECTLHVNATGYNLKYQWYSYNGVTGTELNGETNKSFDVNTTVTGTTKYYVEVTNWDDRVLSSSTFTVTVLPSFEITVTYNNNRGTVTSSVEGRISAGKSVTYTITPKDGCFVTNIYVDGMLLNSTETQNALTNGYTFTNVSSNHTITIEFGVTMYTILVTYDSNGFVYDENNTLIQNGQSVEIEHNSKPKFTFVGVTNYHAEQILIDSIDVGRQKNYRFNNVTKNHTMHINFAVNKYVINLYHNNFGSVQTSESLNDIYDGEDRTFTILVEEGYYVESVKCNGLTLNVEDNTFTISNIHSDINLEVNFKAISPPKNGTTEVILFVGIGAAVLIVIFAPLLMFRKRRR